MVCQQLQQPGGLTEKSCFINGGYEQIQSIVLPNGLAWTFTYDTTTAGNTSATAYGDLIQITEPTGGTISYQWGAGDNPGVAASCNSTSVFVPCRAVESRTVNANDGTPPYMWNYNLAVTSWPASNPSVTVSDPLGNDTVHHFDCLTADSNVFPNSSVATSTPVDAANGCMGTDTFGAYEENQTQYYQGHAADGTLLKTVNTTFTGRVNKYISKYESEPNGVLLVGYSYQTMSIAATATQTVWANGVTEVDAKSYDPGVPTGPAQNDAVTQPGMVTVGSVTSETISQGSQLLKATSTTYQWQHCTGYSSNWLIELPYQQLVLGADGATPLSKTTYGYDGSDCSSQGIFGNQTSMTKWLDGGTDTVSQLVYNSQGMPVKAIDPNGNPTTLTYDVTGLFPSNVQYPTTSNGVTHTEQYQFDSSTGLMLSHTDQNGKTTSYAYDSVDNPTSVVYPDGGSATADYHGYALPLNVTTTTTATPWSFHRIQYRL